MTGLLLLFLIFFYGVAAFVFVLAAIGLWLTIEDMLYERKQRRRQY